MHLSRLKQLVLTLSVAYFGLLSLVPLRIAADEITPTLKRFALIAGANDGGPTRTQLRYAHSDAKAVARVLRQLGGVERKDNILLLEPERFDLEAALSRIRTLIENSQGSGIRLEFIFYYSGHSDEQGLLLGDDLITYKEMREYLAEMPADVKIAVLDSCSSGAMTRRKGGIRRSPFLIDESINVRGYAYMTSASANEAAQESEKVGGSFFTHYLISGMRGAADHSRDGKVTLNEVYQYAFDETLQRTESTSSGPQHASYDFQLAGSGDLVLTDLRGTSSLLIISSEIQGRIFVRDRKGNLTAELNKHDEETVSLGLDAGQYEITVERGTFLQRGKVTLQSGESTLVSSDTLVESSKDLTVARGSGPPVTAEELEDQPSSVILRRFGASLVPGFSTNTNQTRTVINNGSINFIGWGDELQGGEIGALGNIRSGDVLGGQGATFFNVTHGSLKGGQGAGIFNMSGDSVRGFQGTAVVNISGGPVHGGQGSGMLNVARGSLVGIQGAGIGNITRGGESRGLQAAGLFNANSEGSFNGSQIAGLVNINGGTSRGLQGAGLLNLAQKGNSAGIRAAGLMNITAGGSFQGFQAAGLGNITSRHSQGAQFAPLINYADTVSGAQIGLLNIGGDVSGTQIGLVNIATRSMKGAPIGLINFAGNGILAPVFWGSDTSMVNVGLKMGSRHVYALVGAGYHPVGDKSYWSTISGIGVHFDMHPMWLETDAISHWINMDSNWKKQNNINKFRITVGGRIASQISLFAGPTLNFSRSSELTDPDLIPAMWRRTEYSKRNEPTYLRLYVGFTAGIQFEPHLGNLNRWDG